MPQELVNKNATEVGDWALQHYRAHRAQGAVHLAIVSQAEKSGAVCVDVNTPLNVAHKLLVHKLPRGVEAVNNWFESIASHRPAGVLWTDFLPLLKHSRHPFLSIRGLFNTGYARYLVKSQASHELKWKVLRKLELSFFRFTELSDIAVWPPPAKSEVALPRAPEPHNDKLEQFAAGAAFFGCGLTPVACFRQLASSTDTFEGAVDLFCTMPTIAMGLQFLEQFLTSRIARRAFAEVGVLHNFVSKVLNGCQAVFGKLPDKLNTELGSLLFVAAGSLLAQDTFKGVQLPDVFGLCTSGWLSASHDNLSATVERRARDVNGDSVPLQHLLQLLLQRCEKLDPITIQAKQVVRANWSLREAIEAFHTDRSVELAASVVRTLLRSSQGKFLSAFHIVDRFFTTWFFDAVQHSRSATIGDRSIAQEVVDTYFEELYSGMQQQGASSADFTTTLRLSVGRITNGFGLRDAHGRRPCWLFIPRRSLQCYLRILVTTRRLSVIDSTACDHVLATLRMEQLEATFPGEYRTVSEVHILLRFFVTAFRHFLRTIEPDDMSLDSQELSASCAFNALLEFLGIVHQRRPTFNLLEEIATANAISTTFGDDSLKFMTRSQPVTCSTFVTFLGGDWRQREMPDSTVANVLAAPCSKRTLEQLTAKCLSFPIGFVFSAIQLTRVLHWFVFNTYFDEMITFFLSLGAKLPFVLLSGAVNSIVVACIHCSDSRLVRAVVDLVVRRYQFHLAEITPFALILFTWLHFHLRLGHVLWWLLRQWQRLPQALVQVALTDLPRPVRDSLLKMIESELSDLGRDVLLDAPLQHLHAILEPGKGQRRRGLFAQLASEDKISWRRAAYLLRREHLHDRAFSVEEDCILAVETVSALERTGDKLAFNAMWSGALSFIVKLSACQAEKAVDPRLLIATTSVVSKADVVCPLEANAFIARLLLAANDDPAAWLIPLCRSLNKLSRIESNSTDSMNAVTSIVKIALRNMALAPEIVQLIDKFLIQLTQCPSGLLALLSEVPVSLPRQTVIAVGTRLHELREHDALLRFLDLASADKTTLYVLDKAVSLALSVVCPQQVEAARHALSVDMAGEGLSLRDILDAKGRGESVMLDRFRQSCRDRLYDDAATMLLHHPKLLHDPRVQEMFWKLFTTAQFATVIQLSMPLLSHAHEQTHIFDAVGSARSLGAVAVMASAFFERQRLSAAQHRACGVVVAAGLVIISSTVKLDTNVLAFLHVDLGESLIRCLQSESSAGFLASLTACLKTFATRLPLKRLGAMIPYDVLDAVTFCLAEHDPGLCCDLLSERDDLACRQRYCQVLSKSMCLASEGRAYEVTSPVWFESLALLHAHVKYAPSLISNDSAVGLITPLDRSSSPVVICRVLDFARGELKLTPTALKKFERHGFQALNRLLLTSECKVEKETMQRVLGGAVELLRAHSKESASISVILDNLLLTLKAAVMGDKSSDALSRSALAAVYKSVLEHAQGGELNETAQIACIEIVSLIRGAMNAQQLARPDMSWQAALKCLVSDSFEFSQNEQHASRQFEALVSLACSSSTLRCLCIGAQHRNLPFTQHVVTLLKVACVSAGGTKWEDHLAELLPRTKQASTVDGPSFRRALELTTAWDEALALVNLHISRGTRLAPDLYDAALGQICRATDNASMPRCILAQLTIARCAESQIPLSHDFCSDCCSLLLGDDAGVGPEFAQWCEAAEPRLSTLAAISVVLDACSTRAKLYGHSLSEREVLVMQRMFESACKGLASCTPQNMQGNRTILSVATWITVVAPLAPPHSAWRVALAAASAMPPLSLSDDALSSLLVWAASCMADDQKSVACAVAPHFSNPNSRWLAIGVMCERAECSLSKLDRFRQRYNNIQKNICVGPSGSSLVDLVTGCFAQKSPADCGQWVRAARLIAKAACTISSTDDLTPALNALFSRICDAEALLLCANGALAVPGSALCLDSEGLALCVESLTKWKMHSFAMELIKNGRVAAPDSVKTALATLACGASP